MPDPVVAPTSEELAAGLAGFDPEPTIQPIVPETPSDVPKPPAPAEGPKFAYQAAWDKLKADGVKIPESFEKGEFGDLDEWSALHNTILENTEFEEDEDPFITSLKNLPAAQRDQYLRNYAAQQEFYSLPAKDGISAWYQSMKDDKGERKYDDDAIDKYLEGKSPIEIDREWAGIQQQAKQYEQQIYTAMAKPDPAQNRERVEAMNKERSAQALQIASEIDTMTDIGGIPLTEDIKKEAKKNFDLFMRINPETGRPYILQYLSDNKKARDLVLAMTAIDGGHVKKFLSSFKEDFKEEILDYLDSNPKPKSGASPMIAAAQKPDDFV